MINPNTGEFKLDNYNLVIHPKLSRSEFIAGDIPIERTTPLETNFHFSGKINGLNAWFVIRFREEKIEQMTFGRKETVGIEGKQSREQFLEEKRLNDEWLAQAVG